ncbi:MAG: DedA family protein [Reyranella sp.]|nr:DedA family protein [Reyranella sp.]
MEFVSAASVEHLVQSYGLWVLFVVLTLESMGVPAPGESALVTAALYAGSTHQIGIVGVVLTAAAGAVTGDNIGYLIGRSVGAPLIARYGRYVGLSEARLKIGQYLFHRHGGKIVFFGQFVAFLRTFAALLAGMNRMRWPHFLVMNALGGLCWATLFGVGAYLFGAEMKRLTGPIGVVLLAAALAAVGAGIVFFRRHEKELERQAEAALSRRASSSGGKP